MRLTPEKVPVRQMKTETALAVRMPSPRHYRLKGTHRDIGAGVANGAHLEGTALTLAGEQNSIAHTQPYSDPSRVGEGHG